MAAEGSAELTAHLTSGAVVVYAIEYAKRVNWIPMTTDTRVLNRVVSTLLAAGVAFGINATYDATTGRLVVEGLTYLAIMSALWEWIKQIVLQQVIYDTVATKPQPPMRVNSITGNIESKP